jgi:hypothetical protein
MQTASIDVGSMASMDVRVPASSLCDVLLDNPAILLQVAMYIHSVDVYSVGMLDMAISDGRYRSAWLQLLRYVVAQSLLLLLARSHARKTVKQLQH